MADITLNFVNSYRDPRNGKMRHQFRRKGVQEDHAEGPSRLRRVHGALRRAAGAERECSRARRRVEDQAGQHRRADRQVSEARCLHQGTGQGDTGMRGVRSSTTSASA